MPAVLVTRTYLEQQTPAQLVDAARTPRGARIEPVVDCPPAFFRWLYGTVGGPWNWYERSGWDDSRIRGHFQQPAVVLRLLLFGGAPAGFYELIRHPGGDVEIAYIGLVPERIGRGLGGFLVAEAVREGWALGANRVWLHTCSLDGPAALPNYLKRGFVAYKTEEFTVDLPRVPTA